MQKLYQYVGLVFLFGLLAGCTSSIHYEFNNANYAQWRTFYWRSPRRQKIRNPILDSQILTARVEQAVMQVLTNRGYRATSNVKNADFIVTYHATTSMNSYAQPSSSIAVSYNNWYPFYGGPIFVNNYPGVQQAQSDLIIDVISVAKHQLVWRGWVRQPLTQQAYSKKAVMRAIYRIFKRFPPE